MILLSVDTTASTGSLCVAKDGVVLGFREWQKKSSHSEVVTLELESALKEAGLKLPELTHLALDAGPGSFTGIRVGLNLVRSLGYSFQLPTAIFNSLEVLAFQEIAIGNEAIIAIPAVQNLVYAGAFRRSKETLEVLSPVQGLALDELSRMKDQLNMESRVLNDPNPNAQTLVSLLAQRPDLNTFVPWQRVEPLYIRKSEAEEKISEKLRKGLLKPLL